AGIRYHLTELTPPYRLKDDDAIDGLIGARLLREQCRQCNLSKKRVQIQFISILTGTDFGRTTLSTPSLRTACRTADQGDPGRTLPSRRKNSRDAGAGGNPWCQHQYCPPSAEAIGKPGYDRSSSALGILRQMARRRCSTTGKKPGQGQVEADINEAPAPGAGFDPGHWQQDHGATGGGPTPRELLPRAGAATNRCPNQPS